MEPIARYCQNCKAPCTGDFRKVVDLQYSGLVIYVHTKKDKQKKAGDSKYEDTFILHNIGSKRIKKPEYIGELHQFKTKCAQCKPLVVRVRSLLDEIKTIKENEVIGVCEHCKRATRLNKKCKRCDLIVSDFISTQEKTRERQQRFKLWLCKVNHLLQAIVDGESVCQHRVYRDTELERILRALEEPIGMREPDIEFFPNLDQEKLKSFRSMSENAETLEELLSKIEFVGENRDSLSESLHPSPSEEMCLCKYLKENVGGNSGLGSRKSKNSVLSWEPLNDFSGQQHEGGHDSLMKRLLDLSKALSRELYLNKELIQEIIETINAAIKQKLPKNIVFKLINELTELNKTVTRDLSKGLNRKNIQELINDLNDLLTMVSSKDLNHDLIKLLVDLSDLLPHELSECLNKEHLKGESKKEMPQKLSVDLTNALVQKLTYLNSALVAGVLDKNLVRELASDIHKAIDRIPLDELSKIIKEFTKLCKPAVQGIPKTANFKLVEGLISDASKALDLGLSKDQNKKMVHVSINNLNKALTSSTEEVQRLSLGFKKVISTDVSKVLRSRYSKGKTSSEQVRNGEAIHTEVRNGKKAKTKDINKVLSSRYSKGKTSSEQVKNGEAIHTEVRNGKKAITKDINKVLSSRYSKGKTSFEVVRSGEAIHKSLSDSGTGIAKKVTKPGIRATKNPLQLKQQMSEKQSSLKKKVERTEGVNGKEKLLPKYEKKSKDLKSQSKQKLSTAHLRDAKELSAIMLHKNQAKADKFKLNKQRQLDKLTAIERKRVNQLTMKNETKIKKIIPLPSNRDEVSELQMFENKTSFDTKDIEQKAIDPEPLLSKAHFKSAGEPISGRNLKYQTMYKTGAVNYQLSNEECIRKGWTILPEEKIMRRMNLYRMEPANSHNCWFEQHQQDGELFYDSGQKLADIDHNGRGHWYYRNGTIALDYYNAQESNVGQRYVVYSSGTEIEYGKVRPRTVLALFDVLGHGVIYDLHGNLRLKYNQSEGVLVDSKIGPPSKWKWHTLNDPPVLQRVFVDTCLQERDPKLEQLKKSTFSIATTEVARPTHPEMVAIELDNFVKEKRFKLKQKFRPFQIRIKTVKLNEQFSLKILDQATIYLLYRDGVTRLKLNLGMLLRSDEIIDTVSSDVGDVSTPYEIHPAKTESVENLQKILKTVRSGKVQTHGT